MNLYSHELKVLEMLKLDTRYDKFNPWFDLENSGITIYWVPAKTTKYITCPFNLIINNTIYNIKIIRWN